MEPLSSDVNELVQWAAKIATGIGVWWIARQARDKRDELRDDSIAWRERMELQSKHNDEIHDAEIKRLQQDLAAATAAREAEVKRLDERIEKYGDRLFKSVEALKKGQELANTRLVEIETMLKHAQ